MSSGLDVPEGSFETARLTIVAYVREDGSHGYGVHATGDSPMSTYLGLTVVAQDDIKAWGNA